MDVFVCREMKIKQKNSESNEKEFCLNEIGFSACGINKKGELEQKQQQPFNM